MASSSVQFYGINAIVKALENRDIEAWSIWQQKQFMFKGMGIDAFKTTLQMLQNSNSSATYTVRVYEDIEDEKKIKSSTPDDGSFNFKLFENDGGTDYNRIGYTNRKESEENAIIAKIEELGQRLADIEKPEADDSLGIVGKLLDHPVIAGIAPTIINLLVAAITGTKQPQPAQQYIPQNTGTPNQYRNTAISGIDEDKIIKEAIDTLKKYDKDLHIHLQKLASLAINDNNTFNILLTALN
jgi:hypothetical protein